MQAFFHSKINCCKLGFSFKVSSQEVTLGGGEREDPISLDESHINESLEGSGLPLRLREG